MYNLLVLGILATAWASPIGTPFQISVGSLTSPRSMLQHGFGDLENENFVFCRSFSSPPPQNLAQMLLDKHKASIYNVVVNILTFKVEVMQNVQFQYACMRYYPEHEVQALVSLITKNFHYHLYCHWC
jgi:hypothetical protein